MRGMKKRAANFTPEEKNELLEAVLRHRDVLFGRVGPPSRYWAAKKAAWCDVVDAVNTARPTPGRNVHECRRKLKDLKAAARKKFMDANGAWKNDGAKDATAEELKILKLLGSEEKADNDDVDLKIEHDQDKSDVPTPTEPATPRSESDIVIGLISTPVSKMSPIKIRTPSPPPPQLPPTPVPRPQISVIPQAMLKVDPVRRPIGQVTPLPVSGCDNPVTLCQASQNRLKNGTSLQVQSQSQTGQSQTFPALPQRPHVLNVPLNCPSSARTTLNDGKPIDTTLSRKHLRSFEANHGNGQSLPIAEFTAPEPMKRVKLFVRNVPTLTQPSTSVGPTARGNVLNFAICSCKDHPTPVLKDIACQTTDLSENAIMLQSIIDTQKMTARALQNLERIAQHARERGLFGKNGDYDYNQKPKLENVKIEQELPNDICKSCSAEEEDLSKKCDSENKTEEPMDICKECTE